LIFDWFAARILLGILLRKIQSKIKNQKSLNLSIKNPFDSSLKKRKFVLYFRLKQVFRAAKYIGITD